ncbi:hypothetical protein EXIGLDRAFT_750883 [Exidia glandulosa HHB12029]|uniref:Mid2 domain-containing protein n=1 Tax=Exidia glandulosa HHB12029 TaxID=1314781 RepID=A0A165G4D8_EXIGL|nr:hypothetical protein EXIGLDRAFT_750883 [Exidia glandulosa HHB12029]
MFKTVFHLTVLTVLVHFHISSAGVAATMHTVFPNDTNFIQYDNGWVSTTWGGSTSGGPYCSASQQSMHSFTDNTAFHFNFVAANARPTWHFFRLAGVSAQVVLASGPEHTTFSVQLDGAAAGDGDTNAGSPTCSVAWSSGHLNNGRHTASVILHALPGHFYLELLRIIPGSYDDGAGSPPKSPVPDDTPTPKPKPTPSSSPSHSTVSPSSSGHSAASASTALHPNEPSGVQNSTISPSHTDTSSPTSGTSPFPSAPTPTSNRTPMSTSPPSRSQSSSSVVSGLSRRTIIGSAIGAGVVIVLVTLGTIVCYRRRRRGNGQVSSPEPPFDPPPSPSDIKGIAESNALNDAVKLVRNLDLTLDLDPSRDPERAHPTYRPLSTKSPKSPKSIFSPKSPRSLISPKSPKSATGNVPRPSLPLPLPFRTKDVDLIAGWITDFAAGQKHPHISSPA